jgi:hypothetical protein
MTHEYPVIERVKRGKLWFFTSPYSAPLSFRQKKKRITVKFPTNEAASNGPNKLTRREKRLPLTLNNEWTQPSAGGKNH